MFPQATLEHYREQQRLTVATLAAVRRIWRRMGADFDVSWRAVGRDLLILTEAAQLAAVRQGIGYLPAVLAETGQVDDPVGDVIPERFVGDAPDGRSLEGLLYGAVTTAKTASTTTTPGQALGKGGLWLDMATQTLIADTARTAVGVGIAARPAISGYVRMLNTPSCARCVVLAGKWFRWNAGFQRHPRCDCRHIPSSENRAGDYRTDPEAAVEAGHVRGLSKADLRAIVEDGADVGQVINAQRGMHTASAYGRRLKSTLEGTTSRSVAGRTLGATQQPSVAVGDRYRRARTPRLRPEEIYRVASDRTDAIRLLQRFGYVT